MNILIGLVAMMWAKIYLPTLDRVFQRNIITPKTLWHLEQVEKKQLSLEKILQEKYGEEK